MIKKRKIKQKISTRIAKEAKLGLFLTARSLLRGDLWSLALTVLIMAIVFLNMLFTDAVFSGISKAMNENKIEMQYGEITIGPQPGKSYILGYSEIEEFLNTQKECKTLYPMIVAGAEFVNQKNKDGRDFAKIQSSVRGIDPEKPYLFDLNKKIIDGRALKPSDSGKIVVGADLAGGYGASVLSSDLEGLKPKDRVLVSIAGRAAEYEIVGVFKTKNFQTDREAIILDSELRRILGLSPKDASSLVVRLNDKSDAQAVVQKLKVAGFSDYDIKGWQENLAFGAGISKSFEMIGMILQIIGAFVAGLVIFIVIFVDIVNKRRQIGILKAIGIKNRIIILDYILRAMFYVLGGALFGLIFMLLAIALFGKYPIRMPIADVVPYLREKSLILSLVFFAVAGLIGSFLPAYKEIKKKILILLYR